MFVAYVVVTVITALANAAIAVADFAGARSVVANATAVKLPRGWVEPLGVPKAAAAVGLLLGLAGLRWLGVVAAAGLVLFFIGALTVHVRERVFGNIAFPGAFFALAVGSLVLGVAVAA